MEIASDSNAGTSAEALHHEIYKVNKIFRAFCNEQNYLGFKEFKDLDGATEEGESQLTEETFGQLCRFLMVQNPNQNNPDDENFTITIMTLIRVIYSQFRLLNVSNGKLFLR